VSGIFLNGFIGEPVIDGIVPAEGQPLVDPNNPDPNSQTTDHIAENVRQTGASSSQLSVSDAALGLGQVAIPAPVAIS
jgi:hypothetical protein